MWYAELLEWCIQGQTLLSIATKGNKLRIEIYFGHDGENVYVSNDGKRATGKYALSKLSANCKIVPIENLLQVINSIVSLGAVATTD